MINAGGISYASYRVKVVLRELLSYDPDLIVIYTGHNEFLESRTYPEMSEGLSTTNQFKALLSKTNTYKLLERMLEPVAQEDKGQEEIADKSNGPGLLGEEVETLLDQSAGLSMYRRDTVFAAKVFRHFRYNVAEMIGLCRDAGVPVVFCRPVDNLKDFSPFKSSVDPNLSVAHRRELQNVLAQGEELLDGGEFLKAREAYTRAVTIDSLYAMSHYLLGKALLGCGDTASAAMELLMARELDVCPLRAQEPIHNALKQECSASGATLLDLRKIIQDLSPGGLIGDEYLMDHIHPGPEGHLLFARRIYKWMENEFSGWNLASSSLPDAGQMLKSELAKLDDDYFQGGVLNLIKVMVWAGKYREALATLENNPSLIERNGEARYLNAVVHEKLGDLQAAARSYAAALELMPNHLNSLDFLASLYSRNGYYEKAEKLYRRALEFHADAPQLHGNLGVLMANTGRPEEAEAEFKKAYELQPTNAMMLNNLGLLAFRSKQPDKAIDYFQKSLAVAPGNPQAHNFSGLAYMMKQELAQGGKGIHKSSGGRSGGCRRAHQSGQPLPSGRRAGGRGRAVPSGADVRERTA